MRTVTIDEVFDGSFVDLPHARTMLHRYTVRDIETGGTIARHVTMSAARGLIEIYKSLFGGTYRIDETYSLGYGYDVLFSETKEIVERDYSLVSVYHDGRLVADDVTVSEAKDLINLTVERAAPEIDKCIALLIHTVDNLPLWMIDARLHILRLILRPISDIVGVRYVRINDPDNNHRPSPTTDRKPTNKKTGMAKVSSTVKATVKETRSIGVPESVLVARGYSILDAATLRVIYSGTQQTCKEFLRDKLAERGFRLDQVKVIPYGDNSHYRDTFLHGYTAFISGERVISGDRETVGNFLIKEIERRHISDPTKIIRIHKFADKPPTAMACDLPRDPFTPRKYRIDYVGAPMI